MRSVLYHDQLDSSTIGGNVHSQFLSYSKISAIMCSLFSVQLHFFL